MSTSARVESTDAISDADSDVNRMMRWLEGEGLNYWNSAIRKRQEILAKAEEALRFKKLYKDASGSMPSVVEEQKAVKIAKDRLEEAQDKLKNVKHWTRALQKESTLYRGQVSRFSNDVAAGVPAAVSHLGALLEQLYKYMEVAAAGVGEESAVGAGAGGAGREEGEPSMARAADEAAKAEEGTEIDPAVLRAGFPTDEAISGASETEKTTIELACGPVSSEQASAAANMAIEMVPGDERRIVISPRIKGKSRVVLARIDSAAATWYLGPVEGGDSDGYNMMGVGDLRSGRPDWTELLRLPGGFMAVIGPGGVEAIFDSRNERVFRPD
jgi:hypothetical protein